MLMGTDLIHALHRNWLSFAVNSFSNPPFFAYKIVQQNALLLGPRERPSDPGLQRAARLPFPREWLGRLLRAGADINALSGRTICSLNCAARGEPSSVWPHRVLRGVETCVGVQLAPSPIFVWGRFRVDVTSSIRLQQVPDFTRR